MSEYFNSEEMQYLELLKECLEYGNYKSDRTGTGTYGVFGRQMRFDLSDGHIPLLTTKKVFWKGVALELLWFLSGRTDSRILEDNGVNIWKGNTTREFLDSRELYDVPEGDIGTGYGYQWRNWGGDYEKHLHTGEKTGVDQIRILLNDLKENPNSRRHILSAWNVSQLDTMALPPCHLMAQFSVDQNTNTLSCLMYQRSCDMFLGVPFNIASYSLLTILMAHYTGYKPGEFVWTGGDVHLYSNHTEQAKMQIARTPTEFPKLELVNMPHDIELVKLDNLKLVGYNPQSAIKADMSV